MNMCKDLINITSDNHTPWYAHQGFTKNFELTQFSPFLELGDSLCLGRCDGRNLSKEGATDSWPGRAFLRSVDTGLKYFRKVR